MSNAPHNTAWPRIVADYRRALSVGGRRQLGLFAIEGFRLLERALATATPLAKSLSAKTISTHQRPGSRRCSTALPPKTRHSLSFQTTSLAS
jgi:hypothetical protein